MKMSEYLNRTHALGRVVTILAMAVMLGIPAVVCTVYGIWPTLPSIIATAGPLLAMFIPSALSEVVSFTPITGSAGYVASIMGNGLQHQISLCHQRHGADQLQLRH